MAVPAVSVKPIRTALQEAGILCANIGNVLQASDTPQVWRSTAGHKRLVPNPQRDEIARLLESR